jgi:citrate lyase subunit beta / citryl-CoA lyase
MTTPLLRSVLYMPASNSRALEKARSLNADAYIFDLEDAVAPDAKDIARAAVVKALADGGYGTATQVIRINGLGTPWFEADIVAAAESGAQAILVPKIETAEDLTIVDCALSKAKAPASLRLWCMIETPRAVLNLPNIAGHASPRTQALVAGFADLAKDLRTRDRLDRAPLAYTLSALVMAARAHGLVALDGVYPPFSDLIGFQVEAEQARDFGYDGKTLIHPSQIEAANNAFSPSLEEVAQAKLIIATYDAAEALGQGVGVLDGKMIEVLHARQAHALLANIAKITQRQRSKR